MTRFMRSSSSRLSCITAVAVPGSCHGYSTTTPLDSRLNAGRIRLHIATVPPIFRRPMAVRGRGGPPFLLFRRDSQHKTKQRPHHQPVSCSRLAQHSAAQRAAMSGHLRSRAAERYRRGQAGWQGARQQLLVWLLRRPIRPPSWIIR
jgi:hypothetical protein